MTPRTGVDHVDGHRSILFVASPYARRGAVIDHYYSQVNVVCTVEQMLGIRPMNQEDRTATPMFDASPTIRTSLRITRCPTRCR
jgi:hypothetical protein